jgi:uncharacterized membrane protein required for colicin V production
MSYADWVLLLILAALAVNGLWQGLARQVAGLLGLLIGLVVATAFYQPVARALSGVVGGRLALQPLAWVVLLLACWIVANLAGFAARRRAQQGQEDWLDATGGALLGLVTGILLLGGLVAGSVALGVPIARPLAASQVGGWLLDLYRMLGTQLPAWPP